MANSRIVRMAVNVSIISMWLYFYSLQALLVGVPRRRHATSRTRDQPLVRGLERKPRHADRYAAQRHRPANFGSPDRAQNGR